jgi:hypothetical protein
VGRVGVAGLLDLVRVKAADEAWEFTRPAHVRPFGVLVAILRLRSKAVVMDDRLKVVSIERSAVEIHVFDFVEHVFS